MKACAIVPSHDHWRVIGRVVQRLRAAGLPVFVVDDGSGEPAASAMAALHDPASGITVLRLERNQGKGRAVLAGFRLAWEGGFTHAVQVDADGQHDLDALPALLALAADNPRALVSGLPVYDDSMPMGRRIGRWVTHVWVWVETLSLEIRDSMCGFRVYPLAAVQSLLAGRSAKGAELGARMDFDTDIMVRLFWLGVPVRMVPVKVVYPPGNTSNFDLWRDNWRISRMHARLVCGMLLNLPSILRRRAFPGASASPSARHWARMAERGAVWGLNVCAGAYRLLGRRGSAALLAPVALYFLVTGGEQRRASRTFLGRALGRPPTLAEQYRHFLSFALRSLDTVIAWAGGVPAGAVQAADPQALAAAAADPRGAVVVVAHMGSAELSRAVLDEKTRARLTVLVHTRHAENFNRVLRQFSPNAAANLVQVSEIGPETAIALKERVERGEWVVIAGDRVPVDGPRRTSRAAFLGREAAFSQGPWILASLLGCPVHLLFCLRDGDGWRLTLEPFAERIVLPRKDREGALARHVAAYAERLGWHARREPFQWYNFFDFWAQ